jgi:hypothetical protein
VTVINESVFYGCSGLKDVYYHGNQEEWAAIWVSPYDNDQLSAATLHLEEHDYAVWSETTPATCTGRGEENSTCTICGYYVWEDYDKPLDLTWVWIVVGIAAVGAAAAVIIVIKKKKNA